MGKEITNASDETHLRYEELITVRQILRLDDYLLNASTNQEHKSIDGTIILNEALINFTALAEEYRTNYKESFLKDKDEAIPTKVIHVTSEEREDSCKIENMTKKEIMCQIFTKLEELPENDSQLLEDVFNRSVKSKNKDAYVAFYYSLSEN